MMLVSLISEKNDLEELLASSHFPALHFFLFPTSYRTHFNLVLVDEEFEVQYWEVLLKYLKIACNYRKVVHNEHLKKELYYAWTYLDKKVYVKIRFKFSLIFNLVVGWHEVIFLFRFLFLHNRAFFL